MKINAMNSYSNQQNSRSRCQSQQSFHGKPQYKIASDIILDTLNKPKTRSALLDTKSNNLGKQIEELGTNLKKAILESFNKEHPYSTELSESISSKGSEFIDFHPKGKEHIHLAQIQIAMPNETNTAARVSYIDFSHNKSISLSSKDGEIGLIAGKTK